MHALDHYFAQRFLAKKLVDRRRKQILNRSVNCLIVSRKENKVAICKLGTIVFVLFSVVVAVSTHLCVVCRYIAVLCRFFKAISLHCRKLI